MTLAMVALGENQEQFGARLHVSRRTVSRWVSRGSASLSLDDCYTLVRAVHPVDPHLATRIAAACGGTLEGAGIAPPPVRAAAPPAPPPLPPPPARLVDVVVCAAAEALDVSPRIVRPVLLAAFRSARSLGLGVEALEKALSPAAGPAAGKAGRTRRPKAPT